MRLSRDLVLDNAGEVVQSFTGPDAITISSSYCMRTAVVSRSPQRHAMTSSARRTFLANLTRFTAALPFIDWSRDMTQRVPRIGFMSGAEPSLIASFDDEMRKLGYSLGRDIHVEVRLSRMNTRDTAAHAAELGAMDLDFVVVAALPQALAMRQANPKMPMVIITCPGMVSNGFATSLERPGGIYTGMDELPPGVTAKRLQLLKRAAPSVSRVALLSTTPGRGGHETQLAEAEETARDLGFGVKAYRASSLGEITAALDAIRDDRMNGLVNFQGGLSLANRQMIVDFAADHRLPAVYQSLFFVESGGLMAWAPDQREQYRLGARYADQILKGKKPGDIPVRHPEPYRLHLSKKAAAIGLTLPANLVAEADEVLS
jgi:putative ABC transport system substrate-binding protein